MKMLWMFGSEKRFGRMFLSLMVVCVLAAVGFGQTAPNVDAKWSLKANDGRMYHLDGMNRLLVCSDSMILYDYKGIDKIKPAKPSLLIKSGIAKKAATLPPKTSRELYAVSAKWDAQAWLDRHVSAGKPVQIVKAPPFLPFRITLPFDLINKCIVKTGHMAYFGPEFGKRTPFSVYRQQAVVSKGRIVDITGGNAEIPSDGYVLAGHGNGLKAAGASRIRRWCGVGCQVEVNLKKRTFTVITDNETWFLRAAYKIRQAESFVRNNSSRLAARDKAYAEACMKRARNTLADARKMMQAKNLDASWQLLKQSLAYSEQTMQAACLPLPADAVRGVAMGNLGYDHLLVLAKEAGFNRIYLHYYDGTYKDIPALKQTIRRSRELGMEVYMWTWLPSRFPLPADLRAQLAKGVKKNGKETRFVDISVPENRKEAVKAVLKMCRELKPDGVMFDYEFYRGGYSDHSIAAFCKKNGIERAGFDPKGKLALPLALKWEKWRRKLVKRMLYEAADAIHGTGAKVELCVFPGGATGSDQPQMEGSATKPGPVVWLPWLRSGKIDAIAPMFYAQDNKWFEKRLESFCKSVKTQDSTMDVNVWLIYWPETCGWTSPIPTELLLQQTDICVRLGVKGISLFAIGNLNEENHPDFKRFWDAARYGHFRSAFGK